MSSDFRYTEEDAVLAVLRYIAFVWNVGTSFTVAVFRLCTSAVYIISRCFRTLQAFTG